MHGMFYVSPFSSLLHLARYSRRLPCMDCVNGQPDPHFRGELVNEVAVSLLSHSKFTGSLYKTPQLPSGVFSIQLPPWSQ